MVRGRNAGPGLMTHVIKKPVYVATAKITGFIKDKNNIYYDYESIQFHDVKPIHFDLS